MELECQIKDRANRTQRQYMVQWTDILALRKHISVHAKHGYRIGTAARCPILANLHGPLASRQVAQATWRPNREPAVGLCIPQDMIT